MNLILRLAAATLLICLLTGCATSEEIRQKCATASDPAACERAEILKKREADAKLLEQNTQGGGGGY